MGAMTSDEGTMLDSTASIGGVGEDMTQEFLLYLDELQRDGVHFSHVAIWREAFAGGVADHHTLVYEYTRGTKKSVNSVKVDWGRQGLVFQDSAEDPCPNGDIIERKIVRMKPELVKKTVEKLMSASTSTYNVVQWNCQHFSRYMFDQAFHPSSQK